MTAQPEPEKQPKAQRLASRKPFCEPADSEAVVTPILRQIQQLRGRTLFALMCSDINDETCSRVFEWRHELEDAGKRNDLDVLICSPGGELNACYRVARLLASRADVWEALIPDYAASGATLICLGSANLVMSELSQLGPIDPQVISKRREKFFGTERQSPLEAFQALKYLRQYCLESLNASMGFLLQQGVTPTRALDTAVSLASQIVSPLLAKIEPFDIGAFALDSNLSIQYCRRIGNPSKASKKTQRKVSVEGLVEKYPAHEFVIDAEEAKALGFEVTEPTLELEAQFEQLRSNLAPLAEYIGFVTPAEEVHP